MLKDLMTPLERAKAMANGQPVDRLPCNPNIANGVARIYGCKISDFNTDPLAIAKSQMSAYKAFGLDSIRVFTDLFTIAEAMGAKVILPEDNTADLETPAIQDIKDISRLAPINPFKDGRLPVHIEAMKYLKDMSKDYINCSAGIVGPFTNAFFLLGVTETLKLIKKNPDAVHELCKISLASCIEYAKAMLDIGIVPTISEPMSSCTVVSPKVFKEFSLPYLKKLVDFIKAHNISPVIHICGQTDKIWKDVADLGIGGWSIDNAASLTECKKEVGHLTKIMGNVDPGVVMYNGTPLDVKVKTLQCIKDGFDSPKGYVVMSGCSLPVDTPLENISAMMDIVREVGYPVTLDKIEYLMEKYKS